MKKNFPIPDCCNEKQRWLLADIYKLMNHFISDEDETKRRGIKITIYNRVQTLKEDYLLSKNDILHFIYDEFITKEHYLKYNPDKSRRTTFTAHYTYYSLESLLRKLRRKKMKPYFSTISLDADCLDYGCPYKGAGYFPRLSNPDTPEDECARIQLQEIVDDFFDDLDHRVIFGDLERQDAAKERNVTCDAYYKSFQRKLNEFRTVLSGTGYFN